MAASKKMIRIRLKAYDHQLIDKAAETIVETARRTEALGLLLEYQNRRFGAPRTRSFDL